MTISEDPRVLYSALVRNIGSVPPGFHRAMMTNFFGVAQRIGINNLYPRIAVVVDTNQAVSYAIAKARGQAHPVDDVLVDQYAYLVSSDTIAQEFAEHVPEIARKKKIQESALLEIWTSLIAPRMDFRSVFSHRAWIAANEALAGTDPDDVPFLAVFLHLNADVMLTRDRAVRAVLGEYAWTPTRLRGASLCVREGVVALFALHPFGTTAARAIAAILFSIVSTIIRMARELWETLRKWGKELAKKAEKLPDLVKLAGLYLGLKYASTHRDAIVAKVTEIADKARVWMGWVKEKLRVVIDWLRKWSMVVRQLVVLLVDAVLAAADELIALRYGRRLRLDASGRSPSMWLITAR